MAGTGASDGFGLDGGVSVGSGVFGAASASPPICGEGAAVSLSKIELPPSRFAEGGPPCFEEGGPSCSRLLGSCDGNDDGSSEG